MSGSTAQTWPWLGAWQRSTGSAMVGQMAAQRSPGSQSQARPPCGPISHVAYIKQRQPCVNQHTHRMWHTSSSVNHVSTSTHIVCGIHQAASTMCQPAHISHVAYIKQRQPCVNQHTYRMWHTSSSVNHVSTSTHIVCGIHQAASTMCQPAHISYVAYIKQRQPCVNQHTYCMLHQAASTMCQLAHTSYVAYI